MIEKVEDWTFTEHQAYAKGLLNGILVGFVLTMGLIIICIDGYLVFN